MKKWHLRYERGGAMFDLDAQRNHYNNVLNPRSTMTISEQSYRSHRISLNHNNKLENETKRNQSQQNQKLVKTLNAIKNGKGVFSKMEEQAQKSVKKHTLLNEFKEKEKQIDLKRRNRRIVDRIGNARPRIGDLNEWEHYYEELKSRQKNRGAPPYNPLAVLLDKEGLFNTTSVKWKNLFNQTVESMNGNKSEQKIKKNSSRMKKPKRKKIQSERETLSTKQFILRQSFNHEQVKANPETSSLQPQILFAPIAEDSNKN